ncbi:MAG: hypothetical protein Q9170_000356 [Blastenia crenularia]
MPPKGKRDKEKKPPIVWADIPPPDGFVKMKPRVLRDNQLTLETADEVSILMGMLFAVHQNLKPDYHVMEKVCEDLHNRCGFHYKRTKSGFEHTFGPWRRYGELIIGRLGGAHEAVLLGCRAQSDRKVAELKRQKLLPKDWKPITKRNVLKFDEQRDDVIDDEVDKQYLTQPEIVRDSVTAAKPVEEFTAYTPNEAAEADVAKPPLKQTKKRKRTEAIVNGGHKVGESASRSGVDNTTFHNTNESAETCQAKAVSDKFPLSTEPTAPFHQDVIDGAPDVVAGVEGLLDILNSGGDPEVVITQPAKKIRRTRAASKKAVQQQGEVVKESQEGSGPAKGTFTQVKGAPRTKDAIKTKASKFAVFKPTGANIRDTIANCMAKTNDPEPAWCTRAGYAGTEGEYLATEAKKGEANDADELSGRDIDMCKDNLDMAHVLIDMPGKFGGRGPANGIDSIQNVEQGLPNVADIHRNLWQDTGHDVPSPDNEFQVPASDIARHLTEAVNSDRHPTRNIRNARLIQGVPNTGTKIPEVTTEGNATGATQPPIQRKVTKVAVRGATHFESCSAKAAVQVPQECIYVSSCTIAQLGLTMAQEESRADRDQAITRIAATFRKRRQISHKPGGGRKMVYMHGDLDNGYPLEEEEYELDEFDVEDE